MFPVQPTRRLPVYILADRSASMTGQAIVAVNEGLRALRDQLREDPRSLETAWVSVISFGGEATIDRPLTGLTTFEPPTLSPSGGTPLGGALRLLSDSLDRDVQRATPDQPGDYKPLVFLFTDGDPTDDWRKAAQDVKSRATAKTANIIAVGCGPTVNTQTLKDITETVLQMANVSGDSFKSLLSWMSQSVKRASATKNTPEAATTGIDLPPLPPEIKIVM